MKTDVSAVSLRGIVKRFPGVLANDQIDFELRSGEIHSLLGENGAGKSTLMNILAGIYRPDAGTIWVRGRPAQFRSPRDAIACGIGMVHQHFKLVLPHTVAENITLGMKGSFFLRLSRVEEEVRQIAARYGLQVEPKAYVWQLSIGEQQRVEILKMLYRGADILILDEPTGVLTPQESRELFLTLRSMARQGHAIVFISHKLDEVMAISDRITVLRGGRTVATVLPKETNPRQLARLMVGREVLFEPHPREAPPGEVVLEVEGLHALNDRGLPALRGVSFSVRAREILGVAGVAGNGQQELAEVLSGLREATGGRVRLGGRDVTHTSPRELIDEGLSYVPADRLGVATVPNLSLSENVVLKRYREKEFQKGPLLDRLRMDNYAEELIKTFSIMTPGPHVPVRLLSGGNLQKVILAREVSAQHRLTVAMYPTRGLDVGATAFTRGLLARHRDEGAALLLISEDLEELLSLSDRIAVLYSGEIMGILSVEEADVETLGLMMAGSRQVLDRAVEVSRNPHPDPPSGQGP